MRHLALIVLAPCILALPACERKITPLPKPPTENKLKQLKLKDVEKPDADKPEAR